MRNRIAVTAIALTTVLFTALFTIAMSIAYSFEQSNFRQVGGYAHGGLKYLTLEQFEDFKTDPLIKEYGMRRVLGILSKEPFNKSQVEVSYCDANEAKWMFLEPVEGRLPMENTNEAATDTKVLSMLGVEPEIGAEFSLTMDVDGKETTQTFTLCGWWEYDEIIVANHVLTPMSRVEDVFAEFGVQTIAGEVVGTYNMDIMFRSPAHIERDLLTILERHGYQANSRSEGDNYISIGVNWGYVSAQLSDSMDIGTALSLAAALLLIIFTGYLIIYNVFQISVSNDIRSYGLLKTIGTTGRQIRRMVWIQSLLLSCIGIPIGLVIGYGIGAVLTPVLLNTLDGVQTGDLSVSPWIFIGSVAFSLITVLISCRKPSKMAARVSAIEALRYTEGNVKKLSRKKQNKNGKGASLFQMAFANLGRNKSKTIVTITSLSLAVVLLEITVVFTNGFDMDKYLKDMKVDFIVANADYFQVMKQFRNEDAQLPEEVIEEVSQREGIAAGGRTYGNIKLPSEFVTEEYYRHMNERWYSKETLDELIQSKEKEGGLIQTDAFLYGMDPFCLDQLQVISGDLSKLYEEGNYVAAVYQQDDYGNAYEESHWAKAGDKVKLRYTEEWELFNPDTGEIYSEDEGFTYKNVDARSVKYRDVEYEVVATVLLSPKLCYRYYGKDEFIMNADTFIRDTGTDVVMYYAFDMEEGASEGMEAFLRGYTKTAHSECDYESKKTYEEEFNAFCNMFRLMGGALSFIVGLVGVLNFLNAILTGIFTRRREFAVLQSVGMTGKQLKTMLVIEGLLYALGSVVISLALCVLTKPMIGNVLESMFWFFSYRFTILPILFVAPVFALFGTLLPLAAYHTLAKKSVVERLRESEG